MKNLSRLKAESNKMLHRVVEILLQGKFVQNLFQVGFENFERWRKHYPSPWIAISFSTWEYFIWNYFICRISSIGAVQNIVSQFDVKIKDAYKFLSQEAHPSL